MSTSSLLDAPSDWALLQQTVTVSCKPCIPGWTRRETSGGLWTCVRCDKKQYIIDPNAHTCAACPAGAICEDGAFIPVNPADSVWNKTSNGVYRITSCPAGYVLIRDENSPVLDRCVACAPDTYSVEEAVFGEQLWDLSVENYNQYCRPCPRSRARCSGTNDVRPIAGALLTMSSYHVILLHPPPPSLSLACACARALSLSQFPFLPLSPCLSPSSDIDESLFSCKNSRLTHTSALLSAQATGRRSASVILAPQPEGRRNPRLLTSRIAAGALRFTDASPRLPVWRAMRRIPTVSACLEPTVRCVGSATGRMDTESPRMAVGCVMRVARNNRPHRSRSGRVYSACRSF